MCIRDRFEALRAAIGENGAVVDLFDALNLWNGDYYYKTDHHWNTEGAYVGYTALAKEMGFTPTGRSQFEFKLVSNDFYGTLYSKAISPFQEPDSMYLPILKAVSYTHLLVDYACGLCVARFIDRRGKAKLFITINIVINLAPVSYTHLDVYKRQE